MATFEEVKSLIQSTYLEIWAEWYQDKPGITPANHTVTEEDICAGYSHSENLLLNPICKGNLNDPDILDKDGWPIWKIELIHEMLHEYQYKIITKPSSSGKLLYCKYKKSFCGRGHDEIFFSAIAEKAEYFGMTEEQLTKRI